jgi:streptogrisin C
MRKFAPRAKVGLYAFSIVPLFFAMSAAAAVGPSDVSPAVRSAMQRDLGMTSAQLSQYLRVEAQASRQEKQLARAQGASYAGTWIERRADGGFQLVVATTASGRRSLPGVQVRTVRHTLRDLDASKAQLDFALAQGFKVPKGVYGWYVDLPSNTVVVAIGAGQRAAGIDFVARSGADADSVRFVVEPEQPTLRSTLKGGLGYLRNPGDGYLYACSIGFNATRNGSPVFISAGHCGDAGEPVYLEGSPQWTIGPQIGTFAASSFPQPGQTGNDWSYVSVAAGNTQPATVYGWGGGDATVHGSTEAAVGAAICRSGRTSGWECGTIEAKNQTVSYSTGETILNLTRTTACSEGGDSGGSFITGPGQAQGVLSGGSGSCKGKHRNSRSYFQPLLPILSAYNLTLTTN